VVLDRVKDPIARLARNAIPWADYLTTYRGRVVAERLALDGTMTVDVMPDDARLPPMSGVKLKLGLPAVSAQFQPGARVEIGWEGGNPQRPFAALFDGGEADTISMVIKATQLFLGADVAGGAEPATKAISMETTLAALHTAWGTFLTALGTYATSIQPIADPSGSATTTLGTAITAMGTAIGLFTGAAAKRTCLRANVA